MDAKRILRFLRQVMANNNREWFQEHKKEYEAVRADFEKGVQQTIARIMTFDDSIAHLTVKRISRRIRTTWGHTSLRTERSRCMGGTIFIWNRGTVRWRAETTGCPRIS